MNGANTAGAVTKPAKILFLLPSLGGGGAEMHVVRLANELSRSDWSLEIVCLRGGGGYRASLKPNIKVRALCPSFVRSSTISCLAGVAPLARLLRVTRPDLVCSFLPHTNVLLLRAQRMAGTRISTVLGVQNHPGSDWNRRGLSGRLTAGRKPTLAAYRAAKAIVAISNGVAADMETRFPEVADRIRTIYNVGCDDQVFAGAQKPLPAERPAGPLLVACGRLEAQKDYPTLLRATTRLLPEFPTLNLWILGKGREKAALEQLATELGLGDRVQFLGFQANPFSYMAAADVFVLSSRWEGFGNVLVEAMACGTAVVSTRAPFGPEEILENGKRGELCAVSDPDALATSIGVLLRDPQRRQALGEDGRQRASDFAPGPIASAYERVLSEVLNGVRVNQ